MLYFGGQRDWGKGVHCGNVPVKNNTKCTNLCLFFCFSFILCSSLVELMVAIFLFISRMTQPFFSIVKRTAPWQWGEGGRHATPSGRPIWHFVFLWPQKQQSPRFNWAISHRHPNNNELYWTREDLSFEREEIWNFSLACMLLFCTQCHMVLHERPVSWNFIMVFLCIFKHNSHSLARITEFSI